VANSICSPALMRAEGTRRLSTHPCSWSDGSLHRVFHWRRVEVVMRTAIILVALFAGIPVLAQETSQITVKNSAVNNGVVIVTAQVGRALFELQCNKGISGCEVLEPGDYLMVRLPKNHGVYDCANVDIYPKSADPETSQKLGEYCVTEK